MRANTRAKVKPVDCTNNGHLWHPTLSPGEHLCLRCGKKGYCPTCLPLFPQDKRQIVYCAIHAQAEPVKAASR